MFAESRSFLVLRVSIFYLPKKYLFYGKQNLVLCNCEQRKWVVQFTCIRSTQQCSHEGKQMLVSFCRWLLLDYLFAHLTVIISQQVLLLKGKLLSAVSTVSFLFYLITVYWRAIVSSVAVKIFFKDILWRYIRKCFYSQRTVIVCKAVFVYSNTNRPSLMIFIFLFVQR